MRVDRAERRTKRKRLTQANKLVRRKSGAARLSQFTSESWYQKAVQRFSIPIDRREYN